MNEKFKLNIKILKSILLISISLILAFLSLYLFINIKEIFHNIPLSKYEMIVLDAEDFETINYERANNKFVSQNNDGQLVMNNIDININNVLVEFDEVVNENLEVVIYYTDTDDYFNEEMTSRDLIYPGNKQILININHQVKNLRIDIGAKSNQTFILKNIIINNKYNIGIDFNLLSDKNNVIAFFILSLLFCFVGIHFVIEVNKIYDFLFRYRYIIALCFLVILVLLEISGSSIGIWNNYINDIKNNYSSTILGFPRTIRSDEWAVNTPMAFSQVNSTFSYFNDIVRGTKTDMYIVYGQPVLNFGIIFRPFQLGYILFGAAKGLSFFWVARLIALFLITFDFGMLILKKDKLLSLVLTILISFSPLIQWWFAVNGLVEMVVFSELALIMLHRYMNTDNYRKRLLYSFIISLCFCGYILTFYPAWQVPIGYIIIGFLVWIIYDNFKGFKRTGKDVFIILINLLFIILSLGYILTKSWNTIQTVLNTAYPGKRFEVGGNCYEQLFNYPGNIFHAITDLNIPSNVCEMASVYAFFPLGIVLAVYILVIQKKKDSLLISLLAIDALLICWCTFTWIPLIAKVTLLSFSPAQRVLPIVALLNTFILLRTLSLLDEIKTRYMKLFIPLTLVIIIVSYCKENYGIYLTQPRIIISGIILFVGLYCCVKISDNRYKKGFLGVCLLISILGGAIVNPIQSGTDPIYEKTIVKAIKEINNREEGNWIVDALPWPFNNVPIMVGASTINSTNVYPNLDLWKKIDVDKQYEELYNRYAHIPVELISTDQTTFELLNPDLFYLKLDINDLSKLKVDYIISSRDLSNIFNGNNIKLELAYSDAYYKIYHIIK